MAGFTAGLYTEKLTNIPAPYIARLQLWSLGIYTGKSPLDLSPADIRNPVLTASDVTDVTAKFVADPFMLREGGKWYMFFEVWNAYNKQGDIGLAASDNGTEWRYEKIILDEGFSLAYPYAFKWNDGYYMVPESVQTKTVRLYKATDFPCNWTFISTLVSGHEFHDPSVFRYDDRWWMFVASGNKNDTLRLYYSDELIGPWSEHPESPVVEGDANIARPGGRVLVLGNRIIRYGQDDYPTYGNQVRAFRITELTTTTYSEKELEQSPVVEASGKGWNGVGMHTVDAHRISEDEWIACVDGWGDYLTFGLEY